MRAKHFLELYEAQQELFEVEMSPSNLKKLAAGVPGAKVGIEFEMVVPDVEIDDEDRYDEPEEDYSHDPRPDDIDDIVRFFGGEDEYVGQQNSDREVERLGEELTEKFHEWQTEQIDNDWNGPDGKGFFRDWCHNNISDEDVAEHVGKGEDLFGETVPDKEDWEKFIEDEWDEQGDNYNRAYEEYIETKRDEGDFSERDFLHDIGIDEMSDVMRRVNANISWPYYTAPESSYGGGEAIESIGDDFSEAIGKKVYSSSDYHGARRAPDAYSLETDSSINHRSGEAGLEFISPPMPVDEMIEDLKKVKEWADDRGAYTNNSTGLHINVSVPNYSRDDLDYVKLAILLGDKYVLDKFGRIGNTYAKSALDIIKERANSPADVDRLLKQLKGNMETIASKLIHSGRTNKYTSINTKDSYVEFRSAGGDWLDKNFDKIEDTLLRFVVALDAACDPKKYKKEYLKGLYKLLKPKDPKSDMSYLARYMAGEITRSEYAKQLEKTRTERFKDQGIRILHPDDVEENDWVVEYNDGKKENTIYIANTDTVPDESSAFKAAQKFKPNWFRPDTIEYITVKPFKFDPSLDDLKLYRADYGHGLTSVVAENEEEARDYVLAMNPEYFAAHPNTEITLTDEHASKRQINQMIEWQTNKVREGLEWSQRPKIWRVRVVDGSNGYQRYFFIAATTRDNAINVANKLEGEDVEGMQGFDMYIDQNYPDEDTYQEYEKAQEDLIQQREQERQRDRETTEFNKAGEDETIDISNLKTYRLSNYNGYAYFVAENGAEAVEIAMKLEPDKFVRPEDITVQDQSGLVSTSQPSLMRSMYKSQQEKLARLEQSTQPEQYSVYDTSNGRGDNIFIAARTPVEAHTIAARLYPDIFNDEIRTERYGAATQMDANRLLRQQAAREQALRQSNPQFSGSFGSPEPAFSEPSSTRQSWRVQNVDSGEARYFPAIDMQDAINTARREYPAMFPRSAGLYATRASN